ncbi:uncharacterized protein LOC127098014 [Lathyrus oleraceus]|uniref:uncharacterized protein LOC127098014 n=1 Tax=Pisum sativum TaxID=3888 RepID=UPI0021CF363E|nr:uncharacterized protein LOC127098014 [Pisum sativum]
MDPPNTDILELKEMVRDLFRVVQGLALGQKAMAERLERIEGWMIKEKVQGKAPSSEVTNPSGSVVKKSLDSGQPKKKVESGGAQTKRECGKDRYHPYAATATIPVGGSSAPPRHPSPRPGAQRAGDQVRGKGVDRQFDRPPIPYALLLRKLKDLGMVQMRTLAPLEPDQRPTNYDENAKCGFHSGASGHNLEGCRAFKHTVQDLVDSKAINFAQFPNVNANHMPAHGEVEMNAISGDRKTIGLVNEDRLKVPRPVAPKPRRKEGSFPSVDTCCMAVATEGCVLMGDMTQKMKEIDGGKFETLSLIAETVKVENDIGVGKEKKPSVSSYKQALEMLRNGGIPGWGQIIGIVVKADMFGIGYHLGQDSSEQNRGRRPSFTFVSAGMLDPGHAYAGDKEINSDWEIDQWIKSCVPGSWKA